MNALPRIQSFTCPCCHGFIGEAAPLAEVEKVFGGHRLQILKFLAKRVGSSVGRHEIETHLFSSRSDGGPANSTAVVHVELGRLREAIEPYGWTIVSTLGRKSLYRLIPLEAGA